MSEKDLLPENFRMAWLAKGARLRFTSGRGQVMLKDASKEDLLAVLGFMDSEIENLEALLKSMEPPAWG